jgi:hypothetical protein
MRSFLLGFCGALTVLVASAMLAPFYSDYRAAAETSAWMNEIRPLQRQIEEAALKQGTLRGVKERLGQISLDAPALDVLEVLDGGAIVLRGGRNGQLLVVVPSFDSGKVSWRCIGGSKNAVLGACKQKDRT